MGSTGKVQVENLERLTMCEYPEPKFPAYAFGIGRGGEVEGEGKGEELIEMLLKDV